MASVKPTSVATTDEGTPLMVETGAASCTDFDEILEMLRERSSDMLGYVFLKAGLWNG